MTARGGLLSGQAAGAILRAGGVLLLDTDTVPGLHARSDCPSAVSRILDLKGRPDDRPLLLLAAGWRQAAALAGPLDARQRGYCRRCWPGPFSLILPARAGLPAAAAAAGTVAVRIPAVPALRRLIRAVGCPLVSTSANRSGRLPCADLASAVRQFGSLVDGAWTWRTGAAGGDADDAGAGSAPSALIDLTVRPFAVRRQGPLPAPDPS